MPSDPFTDPSGGQKITDYLGRLLLITPLELVEAIQTSVGTSDAVRADVVVLDGDDAPDELSGMLVFQKVLLAELKPRIGKSMLLGVLKTRPTTKKGQSDPYVLEIATDDQKEVARMYLAGKDPFAV
jgi:hypothetical protein